MAAGKPLRAAVRFWQFSVQVTAMRCPICKTPVDSSPQNRYRPFCSERCRMVDLGTWAGEGYRVPGKQTEDREHPDDDPNRKKILH